MEVLSRYFFMNKVYRKLTRDQKERGVIFSSALSKARVEQAGDRIHEVKGNDPEKDRLIRNLKEDEFFDGSQYNYNIIRR